MKTSGTPSVTWVRWASSDWPSLRIYCNGCPVRIADLSVSLSCSLCPLRSAVILTGIAPYGSTLSVMSLLGAIMLIGIVVKNSIVLIDYISLCRERGMAVLNAVVTARTGSRLRPVLMTLPLRPCSV